LEAWAQTWWVHRIWEPWVIFDGFSHDLMGFCRFKRIQMGSNRIQWWCNTRLMFNCRFGWFNFGGFLKGIFECSNRWMKKQPKMFENTINWLYGMFQR
jgi:hypothetical protein